MRILLLAGTSGLADEGAVNISSQICDGLSREHETLCITAAAAPKSIRRIRTFKPDVVHSIHGPSPRTFMLLAMLRLVCPGAVFFATLTLPEPGLFRMRLVLRGFRHIRLLTQDQKSDDFFSQLGFHTQPFPNGIDTERFRPVDPFPIPAALEQALAPEHKVLMHIGHLKPERGMDVLSNLAKENPGWRIVMIGSKRFTGDSQTVQMLKDAGCIVLQDFIENLPALYCRADAYLFPVTHPYGAIDMPLTVLEAMACNRPVLSTPYKALPRFIPEGNGVHYFSTIEEASRHLDLISGGEDKVDTRSQVQKFSWNVLIGRLSNIYREALNA